MKKNNNNNFCFQCGKELEDKEENTIEEKSQPTIELEDENFWRMLEEKEQS